MFSEFWYILYIVTITQLHSLVIPAFESPYYTQYNHCWGLWLHGPDSGSVLAQETFDIDGHFTTAAAKKLLLCHKCPHRSIEQEALNTQLEKNENKLHKSVSEDICYSPWHKIHINYLQSKASPATKYNTN